MKIIETTIPGVLIIEPRVFRDNRGYFTETFNTNTMAELGIKNNFVQDNQSYSAYGTVRGLHFQKGHAAQAKLVRAAMGRVLDVAVDLRKKSPTFGQYVAVELTDEKQNMLLIPRGFAHGFSVLSEHAIFAYKCDNFYTPKAEGGIIYNDPELNIDWRIPAEKQIASGKDLALQAFAEYKKRIK